MPAGLTPRPARGNGDSSRTLPYTTHVNGNMPPSRKAERKPPSPYEAAKKTLQLEIRYQNDSVCTIAVDDGKAQTYRLWNSAKSILSYLPADTAASRPCQFHENSVMLRGYLPDFPNQNLEYIYYERFQDTQR